MQQEQTSSDFNMQILQSLSLPLSLTHTLSPPASLTLSPSFLCILLIYDDKDDETDDNQISWHRNPLGLDQEIFDSTSKIHSRRKTATESKYFGSGEFFYFSRQKYSPQNKANRAVLGSDQLIDQLIGQLQVFSWIQTISRLFIP